MCCSLLLYLSIFVSAILVADEIEKHELSWTQFSLHVVILIFTIQFGQIDSCIRNFGMEILGVNSTSSLLLVEIFTVCANFLSSAKIFERLSLFDRNSEVVHRGSPLWHHCIIFHILSIISYELVILVGIAVIFTRIRINLLADTLLVLIFLHVFASKAIVDEDLSSK